MDNPRNNHEMLTVRVAPEQKKQLKRLADLAGKSVSDYVREAALKLTFDTAKIEFYQWINADLLHLKKFQYIVTRLLLVVGSESLKSDEKIMNYFRECQRDADEKFGTGE